MLKRSGCYDSIRAFKLLNCLLGRNAKRLKKRNKNQIITWNGCDIQTNSEVRIFATVVPLQKNGFGICFCIKRILQIRASNVRFWYSIHDYTWLSAKNLFPTFFNSRYLISDRIFFQIPNESAARLKKQIKYLEIEMSCYVQL